jgi:Ca2+-binding RTX toxin-like protein
MAIDDDVFRAILAMDSYNRREAGLKLSGNAIGDATIGHDSVDESVTGGGFFAQSYVWKGQVIVSYRGTDDYYIGDAVNGWGTGLGDFSSSQAQKAIEYYQKIIQYYGSGMGPEDPTAANVALVGHSLGGGLAGFVASLYGQNATIFNNMAYQFSAERAYYYATTQFVPTSPDDLAYAVNVQAQQQVRSQYYSYYYGTENNGNPPAPDWSGVTAFATIGDPLAFNRAGQAGINSVGADVDLSDLGLSSKLTLHSQSFQVILLFGEKEVSKLPGNDQWKSFTELFPALEDNALAVAAKKVGASGVALDASEMRTMIAYSGIDSGTRPYGDKAIRALFNDANDIGSLLADGKLSEAAGTGQKGKTFREGLADIVVQFAADVANQKADDAKFLDGMATKSNQVLTLNFNKELWSQSSKIVGLESLLHNSFDEDLPSTREALLYNSKIADLAAGISRAVIVLDGQEGVITPSTLPAPLAGGTGGLLAIGADQVDMINGGEGKDVLFGGGGNDTIKGGAGDDYLIGGEGTDTLIGGSGDDVLFGGKDDDKLYGGAGRDRLIGGEGNDNFYVKSGDIVRDSDAGDKLFITQENDANENIVYDELKQSDLLLDALFSEYAGWDGKPLAGYNFFFFGQSIPQNLNDPSSSYSGEYLFINTGKSLIALSFDASTRTLRNPDDFRIVISDYQTGDLGLDILNPAAFMSQAREHFDGWKDYYGSAARLRLTPYLKYLQIALRLEAQVATGEPSNQRQFMTSVGQEIAGTSGIDFLLGDVSDDEITGGGVMDVLVGGAGSDTYRYATGDGDDYIMDYDGASDDVDVLAFDDLNVSDIELSGSGSELYIKVLGASPSIITIVSQFLQGSLDGIEAIRFADGTVWNREQIVTALFEVRGTAGNDYLYAGSQEIDGYLNESTTFYGGLGNDNIYGGDGRDTYVYAKGDGSDTIRDYNDKIGTLRFSDLNPADINLTRWNDTLAIRIDPTGEWISVEPSAGQDAIDRIEFADGTAWDSNAIAAHVQEWLTVGTNFNDSLSTGPGADVLNGKRGDDTLMGNGGDDIYLYASGDGNDRIFDDGETVDTLRLTDLNSQDISLSRSGYDVVITINATGQTITLVYQLYPMYETYGIERIEFADGSSWDRAMIDAIRGTTGNDTLYGTQARPDSFMGGLGDDTLEGRSGSDTYIYSSGDGSDVINDNSGSTSDVDVLRLTDLNASDIMLKRVGDHLEIKIAATNEIIQVNKQFYSETENWGIEKIQFANGTEWDLATINANANTGGTGGDDVIQGTAGDDILDGGAGDDVIDGGDGNDVIIGGEGNDTLFGGAGNDVIYADYGGDTVDAGAGDDFVHIFEQSIGSSSQIVGGEGMDTLVFTAAGATFVGGNWSATEASFERLQSAPNYWWAGSGDGNLIDFANIERLDSNNFYIYGFAGSDTIIGSNGTDIILGGLDDDNLSGADGDDELLGEEGADTLYGGNGTDTLNGGDGNDILSGGLGADVLEGGAGDDTFIFDVAPASGIVDEIVDFGIGSDTISISAGAFGSGLTAGGAITLIANADPSSDGVGTGSVFLYNTSTGSLYFDSDGQGINAAVQFASLSNIPTLTASNISIVA